MLLLDVDYSTCIAVAEKDQNGHFPQEASPPENNISKLLERNRERRKVVSATLGDLKEMDEEEEEEEEDLSINISTSPQSSLTSSFKNKFHLPFSARRSRVGTVNCYVVVW